MVSMIKIGRSVQASDVEQMVKGFSTRIISERINRFGHLFRVRDFTAAREHRYVNIAVDAETVLGVAVIDSLLTNPYRKPLSSKLNTKLPGTSERAEGSFRK